MQIFSRTFSSLRIRNFRYFMLGQTLSQMGNWTQRTAQTWLVYQMTHSAMLVGLLSAFQFAPILLFTLPAGSIIDRVPKRKLLFISQSCFAVLGVIMSVLVLTNTVQYWHVCVIASAYGCLQSIDNPTRKAFVVELVGKDDLINGISLNSTMVNLAKIAGPSLGGWIMVQWSVGACFVVNAISYLAVLTGLFFIHQTTVVATPSKKHIAQDVLEGLRYLWSHAELRFSAIMMLIVCTLNYNQNVIIPIYANEVLHLGAQAYTHLLSATGIGAFAAAFLMSYLAKLGLRRDLYLLVALGTTSLQVAMLFIHDYWVAMGAMVILGFCNMIFLNQSNANFQYDIPANLRGRIMSVYVLLNQGSTPIGSLFVGGVMGTFGGGWGFPAGGMLALALLIPVWFAHRTLLKRWLAPTVLHWHH